MLVLTDGAINAFLNSTTYPLLNVFECNVVFSVQGANVQGARVQGTTTFLSSPARIQFFDFGFHVFVFCCGAIETERKKKIGCVCMHVCVSLPGYAGCETSLGFSES